MEAQPRARYLRCVIKADNDTLNRDFVPVVVPLNRGLAAVHAGEFGRYAQELCSACFL
jgi:hypothetical protein